MKDSSSYKEVLDSFLFQGMGEISLFENQQEINHLSNALMVDLYPLNYNTVKDIERLVQYNGRVKEVKYLHKGKKILELEFIQEELSFDELAARVTEKDGSYVFSTQYSCRVVYSKAIKDLELFVHSLGIKEQ